MINEPVRMIADYLADPTNGVAACLATLTIDAGDTVPTVVVRDSTRDPDVATGRPARLPAGKSGVSVALAQIKGLMAASMTTAHVDGVVMVLVRWEGGSADAAQACTDAGYGIRAALISLRRFWLSASDAQRIRNGVQLFSPHENGIEVTALQPRVETEPLMAGILMPINVRDELT